MTRADRIGRLIGEWLDREQLLRSIMRQFHEWGQRGTVRYCEEILAEKERMRGELQSAAYPLDRQSGSSQLIAAVDIAQNRQAALLIEQVKAAHVMSQRKDLDVVIVEGWWHRAVLQLVDLLERDSRQSDAHALPADAVARADE